MANPLIDLFHDFYNKFRLVVPRNYKFFPEHNESIIFKPYGQIETGQELRLGSYICFQNWPCRKDPDRVVDIILDYKTTVTRVGKRSFRVMESQAFIAYFSTGTTVKQRLPGLRFDYHPQTGLEAGDPLFHLQFDGWSIDQDRLPVGMKKRWSSGELPLKPDPEFLSHVRVPTPRMLLPDLLCFIVADHLRGEKGLVHALVKETKDTLKKVTDLVCDVSIRPDEFWDHSATPNWYCGAER